MRRSARPTRLLFDREYVGELSFDLNEYDLIEDYHVNNLEVVTAIVMAIMHDLSTVDHRLHIGEFSRNAIEAELIELLTNAISPDDRDYDPDSTSRLTNINYRAIRGLASELSTLPSIEPLYRTLKRSVRNIKFAPHGVSFVHDNLIVTIHVLD